MAAEGDRDRGEIENAARFHGDVVRRAATARTRADWEALGDELNRRVLHARRLLLDGRPAAAGAWATGVADAVKDLGGDLFPHQHATALLVRGLSATGLGLVGPAADDLAGAYTLLRDPAVPWPNEAVRDGLIGEAAAGILDLHGYCHDMAPRVGGEGAADYRANAKLVLNAAVSFEERAKDGPRWRLVLADRLLRQAREVDSLEGRHQLIDGAWLLTAARTDDVVEPGDRAMLQALSAEAHRRNLEWAEAAEEAPDRTDVVDDITLLTKRIDGLDRRSHGDDPDLQTPGGEAARREIHLLLRAALAAYARFVGNEAQGRLREGENATHQLAERRGALERVWRISREHETDPSRRLGDAYDYLVAVSEGGSADHQERREILTELAELPRDLLEAGDPRARVAAGLLYAMATQHARALLPGHAAKRGAAAPGADAGADFQEAKWAVERAERHHVLLAKVERAVPAGGRSGSRGRPPAVPPGRALAWDDIATPPPPRLPANDTERRTGELADLRAEIADVAMRANHGGGLGPAVAAAAGRSASGKSAGARRKAATGAAARRPAPADPASVARAARIRPR
ncbi:hypothetical protein LG943_18020 [Streptomonospora sp. S1-112]|uniref:Uncharacterized protein n=1 Tax=Streptomonospora mangrovi TaxID=2883123 RepID=A0A9X3NMU6_9ACTN|nr:hypothetical protein [Streptomonospora mangrovi]MDA0566198.1 hypothetical protein [Streptomonospora mangrovi]